MKPFWPALSLSLALLLAGALYLIGETALYIRAQEFEWQRIDSIHKKMYVEMFADNVELVYEIGRLQDTQRLQKKPY